MFKSYLLAASLLIPSAGFSQNRHRKNFRIEGFSVKTDVLTLFSSILDKASERATLSGEMYFNEEYSLSVDLGVEAASQPGWKRLEKNIGSQFRWYFWQDDCNCSALFVGSYFIASTLRESVDEKLLLNNGVSYTTSTLEGGLTGGFQALLARHFVIDPSVQMGMKLPHEIHYEESSRPNEKDEGLLLRIALGVGYRF